MRSFAKQLRDRPTAAELKFTDLRALTGHQFTFNHPLLGFVIDFYCRRCHLAVEIDGGYHSRLAQRVADEERTASLNRNGVHVERFTNAQVLTSANDVVAALRAITCRRPRPAPRAPSPKPDAIAVLKMAAARGLPVDQIFRRLRGPD